MKARGLLFDLDGTLVDTLDDLTDSMNYGLSALGFPEHSPEVCREMIGHGLAVFAERALGPAGAGQRERLLEVMAAHYRGNCLNRTRVYEGLGDVVNLFYEKGIRLGVLTNKNQQPAEMIVRHYFGADIFDPIVGYAAGRAAKPDPGGVFEILDVWGMRPDEVILVGDSEADAETAARANVRFIGCAWGFRSREQLVSAGTKVLIGRPKEMLDYVDV